MLLVFTKYVSTMEVHWHVPSLAAPKSGPFSPYIMSTNSFAYLFQINKLKSAFKELC